MMRLILVVLAVCTLGLSFRDRSRIKDGIKDRVSNEVINKLDVDIDAKKDEVKFKLPDDDGGDPQCTGDNQDMSPTSQKLVDRLLQWCQRFKCVQKHRNKVRLLMRRYNFKRIIGRLGQDPRDEDFGNGDAEVKEPISGPLITLLIKVFGESRTVIGYLWRYGFLPKVLNKSPKASENFNGTIPPCAVTNAIREFQRWNNINATGVLTKETRALMAMDRCGNADVECETNECKAEMEDDDTHFKRRKRYAFSRRQWLPNSDDKFELTYAFINYPSVETMKNKGYVVMTKERVRKQVEEGFKVWSDVAPLTFRETKNKEDANIKLSFAEGDHGDASPFTGPYGTLAHMYYPTKGLMHFDASENFTDAQKDFRSINLFYTAAHEIGHGIGLKHSSDRRALMYPNYLGYRSPMLGPDDINGITTRYGKGKGVLVPMGAKDGEESNEGSKEKAKEKSCLEQYSAGASSPDKAYLFLFTGNDYVRVEPLDPADKKKRKVPIISDGYPRKISSFFVGVPSPIDYAFTNASEKHTYFFVKDRVYVWSWESMSLKVKAGEERRNTKFKDLPNDVTSIVAYNYYGKRFYFVFYGEKENKFKIIDFRHSKYGKTISDNNPSPFKAKKPSYVVRAAVNSFFPGYFYAFPEKHLSSLISMNRLYRYATSSPTAAAMAKSIMTSYHLNDIVSTWKADDESKYEMC